MASEPLNNVDGITAPDGKPHDISIEGKDYDSEPPKQTDFMDGERKKLKDMQTQTEKMAVRIGQEAVAHMMAMGWTFDAGWEEVKDEKGNMVQKNPRLVVRSLTLVEWQAVQKEKLRRQLTLGQ